MNPGALSDNELAKAFRKTICKYFCVGRECVGCPAHRINHETYKTFSIRELFFRRKK